MQIMEKSLPNIHDMYDSIRQNRDYNVIRKYEGVRKNFAVNAKPTQSKKKHYLDESLRLACSPGPANKANKQEQWANKTEFQCRRGEKQTFLDLIYQKQKKYKEPSPSHYIISQQWPKKKDQLKHISEKTNFADTCQYESDKIPGPGTYNLRLKLLKGQSQKKWQPHKPLQPRQVMGAQVTSYNPCYVQYNTFSRYALMKQTSQPNLLNKSTEKNVKKSKENKSPSPNTYSTISYWAGKSPSKKNERNFFKYISKGPTPSVYN